MLVVGAGLSGATVARQLAEKGHKVTIIEKRNHIAGNCYDYVNDVFIIFHTNSQRVWSYVQNYVNGCHGSIRLKNTLSNII